MKICLINPPYVKKAEEYNEEDRNNSFSGYTLPHLGLGYISAYLKSAGYDVDIIECMGQNIWYEDIADIISNKFYDIIGISVYDGNRKESFRLVDLITRKSAHSFVVFGGYTATLSYESLLKIFRNIQCCCILDNMK